MTRLWASVAVVTIAGQIAATPRADPLEFFRPTVTITEAEQRLLDRGEPIARPLAAQGAEIAVFAAVPVAIDADRLVAWIERIEALKKSSYVAAIHRFSDPPRLEDLADLTLERDDLDAIAECRPGDCGVKLSADEMRTLSSLAADERQQAFRRLLLIRVTRYLAGGDIGPFDDRADAISPAQAFDSVLEHSAFLIRGMAELAEALRRPPRPDSDAGSFLYWSKERIANKPIVIVTDVRVVRSDDPRRPAVLVAGKQIFWTHYLGASLAVTALARGPSPASNYLVYVNRSEVDALRGVFGGLIRWFAQRRLAGEAADVLRGLRMRLESGEPPAREVTDVAPRSAT